MEFKDDADFPKILDNNDQMGHFRRRFFLKKGTIYMCGNSLGLASIDAEEGVTQAVRTWKEDGINIWSVDGNKFYLYANYLAKIMAPIVGADPDEITFISATTINIHQALSTFYKPTKEKYKILVDDINFPTDRYAVDSQVRLKGYEPKDAVKVVKCKSKFLEENDIIAAMTDDVTLILLPTVYYRTAHVLDMKKITDAAKERGIIMGWDLCHAVGAIEIDLKHIDADFAIWCTYKYLNGGPGSPAALYINRRHFGLLPGLAGWYGNKTETQFQLKQEFEHQKDAGGLQIGTPTVFSMATMEGALKMFLEAGLKNLRQKSLHITSYLMYLVEKKLIDYGFTIGNPREEDKRGGHVCLEHDESYRMTLALKSQGVVPDFREPNVIRLTPTALYTSYAEVYEVVEILLDIVKNETYKEFCSKRKYVV